MLNCLSRGKVVEEPFPSYRDGGGYETAIEKCTAGDWLRVVVCIKFNEKLLLLLFIKIENKMTNTTLSTSLKENI